MRQFIQNRKGLKMAVVVEVPPRSKGLAFIMHGLSGYKEQAHILLFANVFKKNGFTTVLFDTTNTFGESEGKIEDATITSSYEDLEDVINWANKQTWYQEPFVLAGHSFGGICSILYAEKHPQKIQALAPISTTISGKLSVEAQQESQPGEFAKWKKTGWHESESRSKPGAIRRFPWSHIEDRLKYDVLPLANMLAMPVLLITGEVDTSSPPKHMQKLFDKLPGPKEFHVIKGAPHTFREKEHLDEVAKLFDKWLQSSVLNQDFKLERIPVGKMERIPVGELKLVVGKRLFLSTTGKEVPTQKEILVTCYSNPDLDGFACAVAYSELLNHERKEAIVWISGKSHPEANFVMKEFGFEYPAKVSHPTSYSKIVLVDSSDLNGLDKCADPQRVIEVIDHRKINDARLFPNAKIQIELVGSAATLIAEKFKKAKTAPSKRAATLLYAAIVSNTLNFKARVTTERDKEMAKWLLSHITIPNDFVRRMFLAKSDLSGNKLKSGIRNDFAWFAFQKKKVGIAQLEIIGGEKLASERVEEIITELDELNAEKKLDFSFLSIIELEEGYNLFIASSPKAQKTLEELFDVRFSNFIVKRPGLIMRKEIVPLLKEKLDE